MEIYELALGSINAFSLLSQLLELGHNGLHAQLNQGKITTEYLMGATKTFASIGEQMGVVTSEAPVPPQPLRGL